MARPPRISGKRRIRSWLAVLAKFLIAGGILYLLTARGYLDFGILVGIELTAESYLRVMAMLLLVVGALILMAVRLQVLLKKQGVSLPLSRALRLTLIGALSGSVLPGVVAGDVVKAIYLFEDTPGRRSSAVSSVLLDRVVGLGSLVLLGAIASFMGLIAGPVSEARPVMLFSLSLLVPVFLGVALVFLVTGPGRRLYWRFHRRVPAKISALLESLIVYRHQPAPLVIAVLLSLLSHGMIVISFALAASLLSEQLSFGLHMIMNPLAMLLNAIPVTPGGLGITETGFAYLYHQVGSAQGAEVALIGRLAQYVVFLVGGLWALFSLQRSTSGRNQELVSS